METQFYNTVNAKGSQLKLYQSKASGQEQKVKHFLRTNQHKWYSQWDIKRLLFNGKIKDGSLSRAMTNLTKQGYAEKSEMPMVIGECGIKVYAWRYK